MTKLTFPCACLVVLLVGCGAARPPKNASDTPDPASTESTEPEKSKEAEPSKPASSEPAAPEAKPAAEAPKAKPGCEGLVKSKCKVTVGCAWYEQPGKSKCVDE
ncbi:MAG: hypothetical protein HY898_15335 [Deltaproteobacteria bacterium]|nr:hypothetical protein [Deltaproteobacteria bacterium]